MRLLRRKRKRSKGDGLPDSQYHVNHLVLDIHRKPSTSANIDNHISVSLRLLTRLFRATRSSEDFCLPNRGGPGGRPGRGEKNPSQGCVKIRTSLLECGAIGARGLSSGWPTR